MQTSIFSRFVRHFLLWSGIALPLLVTGPLSMFSANFGDFDLGSKQLALLILPYLSIPLMAAVVTSILPFQGFVQLILAWLVIGLYVQGNIAVWDYGRFDGSEIAWSKFAYRGYADLCIWVGILLLLLLGRRRILKELPLIVSAVCCLQIGSATLAFIGSKAPYEVKTPDARGDALPSFSKEKGVLMIILDEFSSQAFYSLLGTQPQLKSEFADFTYYRDVLAAFPTTYAAVPAILTGQPAPLTSSLSAYFESAGPSAINEQLGRSGWSSEVVTFHPICKKFTSSRCQSLTQATSTDPVSAAKTELYKLLDLTLFRHAPHQLKVRIYNDEHWFLQNEGLNSLSPSHQGSIRFVEQFQGKIRGDAAQPTFKLLHLLVPHGPYNLTPECERYKGPSISPSRMFTYNARCALKLVDTVLERLKEAGVYDATTIVLLADHGTPIGFDLQGFGTPLHRNLRRAVPLLMVKPAGYRAPPGAELRVDTRPLSQLEILGLINDTAHLGLSVPPTQARTPEGGRFFHNYAWRHDNWSSDILPKSKTWVISGDSWNMDNWQAQKPLQ
jgi:hypothetical protein